MNLPSFAPIAAESILRTHRHYSTGWIDSCQIRRNLSLISFCSHLEKEELRELYQYCCTCLLINHYFSLSFIIVLILSFRK